MTNYRLFGNLDLLTELAGEGEFRVMLVVDIEGYSAHPTDEQEILALELQRIVPEAFQASALNFDACVHLDEGDSIATVFPRDFGHRESVIDPLLYNLNGKLREYNRHAAEGIRLRLRAAVHMGFVRYSGTTLLSDDFNLLFRLCGCAPLKTALHRAEDAHLAVAVSSHVYRTLVRPEKGNIDRSRYHPMTVDLHNIGAEQVWLTLVGDVEKGPEFWAAMAAGETEPPTGEQPVTEESVQPPVPEETPQPPIINGPEPPPATRGFAGRTIDTLGTATSAVAGRLGGAASRLWRRRRRPGKWGLIGASAIMVVAVLLLGYFRLYVPYHGPCPPRTQLNVLTSADGFGPVNDAAQAYQAATSSHGCPRVEMIVYPTPDSEAREGLANGWRLPHDLWSGPPPNIWMPDTSADRAMVPSGRLTTARVRLRAVGSTRASPYVVGVPVPAAKKVAVKQVGSAWPDLYKALTDVNLTLARPPATSTTALAQTSALWTDLISGKPGHPDERGLEHELANADLTGGDEDAMLCSLRERGSAPDAAVLVTERALAAYNRGERLGDRCGKQDPPATDRKLVPFYPGTPRMADYPMYEVTYGTGAADAHQEVTAFHNWLAADPQGVLAAAGYRPPGGGPPTQGLLTDPDAGVGPGSAFDNVGVALAPPAPVGGRGLTAFDHSLSDLRGNMWVLVAVDTSQTMNTPTTRGTRFDASLDAMTEAGGRLSAGDRIALWRFPGSAGAATGHGEPLPFDAGGSGADVTAQATAYSTAVSKLEPDAERTPLYETVRDGVEELNRHAGNGAHLGLLVISDGRDDTGGKGKVSAEALSKVLRTDGRNVRVLLANPVRGGCSLPALRTAGITCASLDGPGDPVGDFLTRLRGE